MVDHWIDNADSWICSRCGYETSVNSPVCPRCGATMVDIEVANQQAINSIKKRKKIKDLYLAPSGYLGYKKPTLWMKQGDTLRKLATFTGEEEAKIFMQMGKRENG